MTSADHLLAVPGRVVPARRLGFPDTRMVGPGGVALAEMGRLSWFNVFLGRGQRVILPGGTRWRVRAFTRSRWVCPMVAAEGGTTIARSGPGERNYGINTRDHAYSLNPAETRRGRARRWVIVEHETEIAVVTTHPFTIDPHGPVHLGVAVLAFTLATFGVLGEKTLMPTMQPQ